MEASQADEAQTHSEPAQAETETNEQSGPDFRAHVRVKPNPSMVCLSTAPAYCNNGIHSNPCLENDALRQRPTGVPEDGAGLTRPIHCPKGELRWHVPA